MKKPLFNKICIVGVGLIGGSLGMAIKRRKLAKLVIGVVRKKSTAEEAMRKHALDVALFDLNEGVNGSDLVVLCAPVGTILRQIGQIGRHLGAKTVVIDVGSSKSEICKAAGKLWGQTPLTPRAKRKGSEGSDPRPTFVGCHPMAGSEKCGVEFAEENLFEDSVCFMTSRHAGVESLWKAVGATPRFVTAEAHDRLVAKCSHVPHALAFSLFQSGSDLPFASNPSLRALARLAKSSPEIWSEIFVTNKGPVVRALEAIQRDLKAFTRAVASSDAKKIRAFIARANAISSKY